MIRQLPQSLKRVGALMMSLLLVVAQLAMPVAALAMGVTELPTVTVYYQLTAEETPTPMPIFASPYAGTYVYWGQLPEAALAYPITLEVMGSGDPSFTYSPAPGTQITPVNAPAVDGMSISATIEVWQESVPVSSFPLYLSTIAIPPEIVIPQNVWVQINYQAADGTVLLSDSEELAPGSHTLSARRASEVEAMGYVLSGSDSADVTVNEDGSYSPNPVVFTFDTAQPPEPQNVWVQINYQAADGTVLLSDSEELAPGSHTLTARRASEVEAMGYVLSGSGSADVTVNEDGSYSPNPVVFTFDTAQPPEPQNVWVQINYQAADGTVLLSDSEELAPGPHTLSARRASEVEAMGYVLSGSDSADVTVNEDGSYSPNPVVFTFDTAQPPEPQNVWVQINYQTADGTVLLSDSEELAPGPHTLSARRAGEVEAMGYVLSGSDSADVTVNEDGSYSPNPVVFTFDTAQPPEPQNVWVQIEYQAADGTVLLTDSEELAPGSHTLSARRASEVEAQGYVLSGSDSADVTVNGDGSYSPNPVVFTFDTAQPPEPQNVWVQINYQAADGTVLLTDSEELAPGSHTLSARRASEVEAQGYVLSGSDSADVTVNEDGSYSPNPVVFTFDTAQPPEPQNVWVQINYQAADGTVLLTDSEELAPGPHTLSARRAGEVEAMGYKLSGSGSADVIVNGDGSYSPNPVVFTFDTAQPPAETEINRDGKTNSKVNFRSSPSKANKSNIIFSNVAKGTPVWVYGSLQSEDAEWLRIRYQETDCYVVAQYIDYSAAEPITADVTFRYLDTAGKQLANDRVEPLTAGNYATNNYQIPAPNGYTFQSVDFSEVIVNESGANPATVTFTYAPNPVAGKIILRYVDTKGAPVANERTEVLGAGTYSASTFAISVPSGYTYQGVSSESFTIDAQGVATPDTLTYTYAAAETPKNAEVTISYLDTQGKPVAEAVVKTLKPGTYGAGEFSIAAPEGYILQGASAEQIVVSNEGVAKPASLSFTYTKINTPLAKAKVAFSYVSSTGKVVADPMTVELEQGTHNTREYAAAPQGYTLQGVTSDTVTVDAQGVANPAQITFTYTQNQTNARVEVHYTNAIGEDFPNSPQILELGAGTHQVSPTASYVPNGYTLSSGSKASYQITVDNNFVATPNSVTFTYYNNAVSATVKVHYVDASTGKDIAVEELKLTPGTHPITPNAAVVPSTYKLSDASVTSVTVVVNENGVASNTQVIFYYQPVQINVYMGYAVTTQQTALRNPPPDNSDSSIIATLPAGTLLYISGQYTSGNTVWSSAQTVLENQLNGLVLDNATRRISKAEAQAMIDEYNKNHPSQPEQSSGYYITIGSNVPLRTVADPYAGVQYYLAIDTVVYVSGQVYQNNQGWHISSYEGYTGYIRADQLRKMTTAEVEAYLAGIKPTPPAPTKTAAPYDPYAKSSYGYVTSSTVNFRSTPNGTKLKTLNKYAFGLVLGTKEVNGVTWYNVNQSGVIGWVHGSYFHQLNLTELTSFLNSKEYLQGLQNSSQSGNNSGSGNNNGNNNGSGGSSGSPTQGNISSLEDWNVGTWQNTGITTQTSYAPFNPYATPSVSASVSPSASAEPTATFVIGTMIPIDYEDESKETQTDSVPWGVIGAGVALLGGAGGVYAYALNQNKKRKAAARAAASRRTAGTTAGGERSGASAANGQQAQSPYTRRAVAAPPVAGTRENGNKPDGNAGVTTGSATYGGMKNPYSSGSITGAATGAANDPYLRPTNAPTANRPGTESLNSNPYTRPGGTGTESNGGAYGTGAQPRSASTDSNPYARPIGSQTGAPRASKPDASSDAKRSTRMRRYHDAEDGEGGNKGH